MHCRQNLITARLQRKMQMLTNLRHFRHRRKNLRAHIFRMRAGKTHPSDAFHLADRPHQVAKERAHSHSFALASPSQLQVAPVGVHILP